MTEAEQSLINDLNAIKAQQEKIAGEIQALKTSSNTLQETITALEDQLTAAGAGAGSTVPSAELVAAVAAVKVQAQALDDLIPDAPATA